MIKKIQEESGSRVQFKPEDEMGGPNRICSVQGNEQGNQIAADMIRDLVENGLVCHTCHTLLVFENGLVCPPVLLAWYLRLDWYIHQSYLHGI